MSGVSSSPGASTMFDRLPTIGGGLLLVLVVLCVVVGAYNRGLQDRVNAGQARLANAQTEANLDNTLIQLLVKSAAEHDDAGIKSLLSANGISYAPAANSAKPTGGTAQ